MCAAHHWIELEDHLGRRYRDMQMLVYRQPVGMHRGKMRSLRTLFTMFVCARCGEHAMKPVDVYVSSNGARW